MLGRRLRPELLPHLLNLLDLLLRHLLDALHRLDVLSQLNGLRSRLLLRLRPGLWLRLSGLLLGLRLRSRLGLRLSWLLLR